MTNLRSRRSAAGAAVESRALTLGRRLLFLQLLLSPLLFWRGGHEAFEFIKITGLMATAIALAALAWLDWETGLRRRWSLADLGVLFLVLSAAASTANSLSWRVSLWGTTDSHCGLIAISAYAIVFISARRFCRTDADRRQLLLAVPLAAAIASSYALLQHAGLDPVAWDSVAIIHGVGRPAATLGHPNLLGAYLALAAPITLAFAHETRASRPRRALAFALIALLELAALVLTLSRAAWLAAAVAGIIMFAGLRPRLRWLALGTAAFALVVALLGGAAIIERLRHFSDPSGRFLIWKTAWSVFLDHPFLGCGPDAFQLAFPRYRLPEFWELEWGTTPIKAHNDGLQLLATQGLLGWIAAGVIAVGLIREARAAWRQVAPTDRFWLVAIIAALAALVVQGQFGFTSSGTASLAIVLAALIRTPPSTDFANPRGYKSALRWAGVIPACVLGYYLVYVPLAASHACRMGEVLLVSDPSEAFVAFQRATTLAPENDLYWSRYGTAALEAAESQTDARERSRCFETARTAFSAAVRLVPTDAFHHHNLAQALAETSPSEAFAEFAAALRLDPNNPEFALDAARLALQQRDAGRARAYIEPNLGRYPSYAPLRAEWAYLALLENRPEEALAELAAAQSADWHGDAEAARRASFVQQELLRRMRR
jgi:O-antigen ligase